MDVRPNYSGTSIAQWFDQHIVAAGRVLTACRCRRAAGAGGDPGQSDHGCARLPRYPHRDAEQAGNTPRCTLNLVADGERRLSSPRPIGPLWS
jgi:hypothetical protein